MIGVILGNNGASWRKRLLVVALPRSSRSNLVLGAHHVTPQPHCKVMQARQVCLPPFTFFRFCHLAEPHARSAMDDNTPTFLVWAEKSLQGCVHFLPCSQLGTFLVGVAQASNLPQHSKCLLSWKFQCYQPHQHALQRQMIDIKALATRIWREQQCAFASVLVQALK
eukprot:CAMPEP_0172761244 /NCGR_PEP_ID=MMETSP1074-20121228/171221_1 /TAXON_ID=2916 /ORGANISM="Ceratium fusus, Strain PA161109" /LENGTH=166 /DNA_ID=CAMNT_0013595411 /DNA_START=901 /DNA_END=1401 /DNA_ORIENTATION=+